jgi:hypothetical protein
MSNDTPSEPNTGDFSEAADKSQDAGIADEGAAYTNAIKKTEGAEPEVIQPEEVPKGSN